jgi:hypothetical protein
MSLFLILTVLSISGSAQDLQEQQLHEMDDSESIAMRASPGNLPTKEVIEEAVAKIDSVQTELEQFKTDNESKLIIIGVVLCLLVVYNVNTGLKIVFDSFLSDCCCPGDSKKRKSKSNKRRSKSRSRSRSSSRSGSP